MAHHASAVGCNRACLPCAAVVHEAAIGRAAVGRAKIVMTETSGAVRDGCWLYEQRGSSVWRFAPLTKESRQ